MHHTISFLLRIAYAAGFGYILLFHPEDILNYIPQLLGGLLMLECIAQFLELLFLKAKTTVSGAYFIVPTVILLYSLFLIFGCQMNLDENTRIRELFHPSNGMSYLSLELMLGGLCFIGFTISEIVISIAFFKPLYQPKKFEEERRLAEQQEQLEEPKNPETV